MSKSISTLQAKSIAIHTLKPDNSRPAHTMSILNWPTAEKTSQFRYPHKNQVKFIPSDETKLINVQTLKSSHLRLPLWKQVNFDSPWPKKQINFDLDAEPSHIRSPHRCLHWNQVNSGPPRRNQVCFAHPNNQVGFDTKSKALSLSSGVILRVTHTGTCSSDTAAVGTT